MALTTERVITIATAYGPWATTWKNQNTTFAAFCAGLEEPLRDSRWTFAEYKQLDGGLKNDAKSMAGSYVGARLKDTGPRQTANIDKRTMITLDCDSLPAGGFEKIEKGIKKYGLSACVYSTRSSSDGAPKCRVLIETDRDMDLDEYQALARRMADYIGVIDFTDASCFRPAQCMHYPCVSSDQKYYYRRYEGCAVEVDEFLQIGYKDWRDVDEWPTTLSEKRAGYSEYKQITKTGNWRKATEYGGWRGAFNKTYPLRKAIEMYLSEIYEPYSDKRYTYIPGTTKGGLYIDDETETCYSFHGTDPAGDGHRHDAYSLVKIHLYGDDSERR